MKFDFSDIFNNIEKDIEITEEQLVNLAAKVTLDVHRDLVLATPVDTGTARRGWEPTTPTTPYEDGTVENNVDYIVDLNNGHSAQAPSGFVEAIVQRYNGGANE